MRTYTAVARRAADGWDVVLPDLPQVQVHADRLDQVIDLTREAVVVALDVDVSEVEVDLRTAVEDQVDADVRDVTAAHRQGEAARTVVTAQQRLAHRMARMGLSHHDSAYLLNISHHRVRQMVDSDPGEVPEESPEPGHQPGSGDDPKS